MAYAARHPSERFWDKVERGSEEECWEWRGTRESRGYGVLFAGPLYPSTARIVKAHRISWEIHYGAIPEGQFVLHHCDNRPCVNPKHLYIGSHKENVRDRAVRKRGKEQRQNGEENDNSKLTQAQVFAIDAGYRAGFSQMELARMFDISQPQVSRIVRHESWRHLWGDNDGE